MSLRAPSLLAAVIAFATLTGFRPDDPDSTGLFRFEPGFDVEHHDGAGGVVRVHFTRNGPDATSPLDENENGVPDSVEQVAVAYEDVFAFFAAQGFRAPLPDVGNPRGDGGSDAFDVYLIDFGGAADGAFVRDVCETDTSICNGFVAQENDFVGYRYPSFREASRILASHELFHAVQAAYDSDIGANWSEATATWASEHFDPSLNDFEHLIDGWFAKPDRSIDQEPVGPVDGFSYGLAIFAQFLSERFGDGIIAAHLADLEDGARGVANPTWVAALSALLEREHASDFATTWQEFAEWVLKSGYGEVDGTFANAATYPRVARDVVSSPFSDERLRVYRASMQVWSTNPGTRSTMAAALASTDPAEVDALTLVLATRAGVRFASAHGETLRDGVVGAEIDAVGATEVIVMVVSHATSGQSRRPGLCFGDPAEVANCVALLAPEGQAAEIVEGVESGPEVSAVEPSETAEFVEAVEVVMRPPADEGGCSQGSSSLVGIGMLFVFMAIRRRAV